MSKAQWPTEVPILSARDFCKRAFEKGSQRCLNQWHREVFRFSDSDSWAKALAAIARAAETPHIIDFNDSPNVTKTMLARVWNRAMAKLGYVVGNPEA